MNKILTFMLFAAGIFFSQSAWARAQSFGSLNLTAEQRAEAEHIFARGQKKIELLQEQEQSIKEQIRRQHQENLQEFERILTPEQQSRLLKDKKMVIGQKYQTRKMRGLHDVTPLTDPSGCSCKKAKPEKGMKKPKDKPIKPKGGFVAE